MKKLFLSLLVASTAYSQIDLKPASGGGGLTAPVALATQSDNNAGSMTNANAASIFTSGIAIPQSNLGNATYGGFFARTNYPVVTVAGAITNTVVVPLDTNAVAWQTYYSFCAGTNFSGYLRVSVQGAGSLGNDWTSYWRDISGTVTGTLLANTYLALDSQWGVSFGSGPISGDVFLFLTPTAKLRCSGTYIETSASYMFGGCKAWGSFLAPTSITFYLTTGNFPTNCIFETLSYRRNP